MKVERMAETTEGQTVTPAQTGTEGEPNVVVSSENQPRGWWDKAKGLVGAGESAPKPQVLIQQQPPEGVSPSVEAVRKAGYVETTVSQARWQSEPLEIRGQLVAVPEIIPGPEEGESPESVTSKIITIDRMPAEQREANAAVNAQYAELLTDYANGDQAIQEDHQITTLRKQLINLDKAYMDSDPDRTDEEKDALLQLLNNLDEAELNSGRHRETLNLRVEKPNLYPDLDWQNQENLLHQFDGRVELLKSEIADDEFIQRRTEKKAEIEREITRIRDEAKIREAEERRKRLAEPSEEQQRWLEEHGKLEKDRPIALTEDEIANLPKFSDALEQLKIQDNQSKEDVGWYFQEAGRLGLLFDLNEQLDSDFVDYLVSLHIKPVDERRFPPPKMTIGELRNSIRAKLEGRDMRTPLSPGSVELDEAWEDLTDTVSFSATRTRDQFAGVRAEYLRRGYEQMRASFTNLIHLQARLKLQTDLIAGRITDVEYREKVANIPRDTQQNHQVYGEWNFGFEAGIRQQVEKLTLAEQAKPLFHETELGFIVLGGENSREIELAAEQAAEFITSSAGAYSLEAVQQRREYLLRAIENKRAILSAETGGIKGETDRLTNRIKDVALNKLDFFILHWLAQNLRMPEYSSYFEQTVMQRGTDRLKLVPTMSDGLVGLAINLLLSDEYRLYCRPGGFKNHLNQSDAQSYLRRQLRQRLVDTIMGFELDDQGKGWQGKAEMLKDLMKVQSPDGFIKYFIEHNKADPDSQHPAERLQRAEKAYQDAFEQVKATPDDPRLLIQLREATDLLAFEHSRYQAANNRAENAVDEAIRVMDITGESSRLGSPTIRMKHGDHINADEATLFYKFAILQAAKNYGLQNGMEDNQALIRWRSRMWIDRWKKAGLDRVKAGRSFVAGGSNGNKLGVGLKEGWEETGLTEEEWQAFESAAKELRANGYNARLKVQVRQKDGSYREEEVKFKDIIKMRELQPVLSNFLADYKSSKDQLNDEYLRLQAFKGRLPSFKNILIRLGIKKPIEGSSQRVMNEYTRRIEDSRQFHAEIERLTYYEATHASLEKAKQQREDRTIYMDSAFFADRIDYGYQGLPWGIKRAQHRKAFNYNNLGRTTSRAVDLIHAIPFSLTSLSQESSSEDILDMFWNLNRSEKDDNWTLMTFAMRNKDAWFIGGKLDGGDVDIDKGESKQWTFLEKPLVDSSNMWTFIAGIVGGATPRQAVERLVQGQGITEDNAEKIVNYLLEKTFIRFRPLVDGAEKILANDRQALGSGAGYEENEKFALRFLEWLLSEKEGDGREQGGMEAYEDVADIIRFITRPGSYKTAYQTKEGKKVSMVEGRERYVAEGDKKEYGKNELVLDLEKSSSIWDELWRKMTPGHNPRIPTIAPDPTYRALAA